MILQNTVFVCSGIYDLSGKTLWSSTHLTCAQTKRRAGSTVHSCKLSVPFSSRAQVSGTGTPVGVVVDAGVLFIYEMCRVAVGYQDNLDELYAGETFYDRAYAHDRGQMLPRFTEWWNG